MENIEGSVFNEFNWIHSKKQLKQILLNNTVLIKGEDLPDRKKIRLTSYNRSTLWLKKKIQ